MKKILYIEDEQDQIAVMKMRLEENGYRVVCAKDGAEGLLMAEKEKPDLVLLDLFLPKVKGFDVCRKLKENPETKNIPIIVITASGSAHLEEQVMDCGASSCVTKPYESKDLLKEIEKLIG